ncbi:MAG: hypothetical protein Kow0031_00720 [Anaerolineae bacterium]
MDEAVYCLTEPLYSKPAKTITFTIPRAGLWHRPIHWKLAAGLAIILMIFRQQPDGEEYFVGGDTFSEQIFTHNAAGDGMGAAG